MSTLVDDIGSFPLPTSIGKEEFYRVYQAAREALNQGKDITKDSFLNEKFCKVVLESFKKKAATGLDVVNFPQQYDGIRQIDDVIHQAMEKGSFTVDEDKAVLPEVQLINQHAKTLCEELCLEKINLRVSLFGPMEQYLHEIGRNAYPDVIEGFVETIRRFAKNSVLNSKYIETKVVSIDEPSFGYNNILAAPEVIRDLLNKAFDFQCATKQIHLHFASGVHDLLSVANLDVLSFEFAASPGNIDAVSKSMLEGADKHIRVGVSRTDIDTVVAELYEKGIPKPTVEQLVESEETIRNRYRLAKNKYDERMTFTGPDCGLSGWPSQEAAELVLKRTVRAVKNQ
jgi:methionine synthase II (cobalamin-independent)